MILGTIFVISSLLIVPNYAHDSWIDPNAWDLYSDSKSKPSDSCPVCEPPTNECPVCEAPNGSNPPEQLTAIYYKTVINTLLNRSFFKKNPETGNLERVLHLSLSNAQMTAVENWKEIQDLNAIVSLVLSRAKELKVNNKENENKSTFSTTISWFGQFCMFITRLFYRLGESLIYVSSNSAEVRFIMTAIGVMLAIYSIHKRYNKNLVLLVIGSFIMFGYFVTYIECNRKLEVESFIEFTRKNEPDEPNFFSKMLGNFFKTSKKEEKIQELKNQAKVKLPFCRPDDVAIMYFNEMFFNQLQVMVQKIADSMTIVRDTVPFPFNYMGMIALPFLFWSLIPLVFHYFLNPATWYNIMTSGSQPRGNTNVPSDQDRISGENLRIFLNAIKNVCSNDPQPQPAHSSIEDVKDLPLAIEKKPNESPDKNSKNETIKSEISLSDLGSDEGADEDKELYKSQNDREKVKTISSSADSS